MVTGESSRVVEVVDGVYLIHCCIHHVRSVQIPSKLTVRSGRKVPCLKGDDGER